MIFSEQVPVIVAMATGTAGLLAGWAYATLAARDKLRVARRLVSEALRCETEARRAYTTARALTEPTGAISTVELFPPSLPRRMHRAVAEAVERFTRNEPAPEWADGEMTRAFARAEKEQEAVPATPYVGPGVSRGRQHAEGVHAILPARMRQWGPRLVHSLDGPVRMPERFGAIQLPAQRRPTPLVMAALPDDDTRQFRVKVVDA
jgi:hypothetical protein